MSRRSLASTVLAVGLLLFASSDVFAAGFLVGGGVNTSNGTLPPDTGAYLTAQQVHAIYTGSGDTLDLTQVMFEPNADSALRTVVNVTDLQVKFNSHLRGMVSPNGGVPLPFAVVGFVTVVIERYSNGDTGTFDTQITALNLSGFAGGIRIDKGLGESTGETRITNNGDGTFHIDSFFDLFTDLTIDGGITWIPQTNGPTRIDLQGVPEPATFTLLGIGLVGIAAYVWRRHKPMPPKTAHTNSPASAG
jgi:hypothetical protein